MIKSIKKIALILLLLPLLSSCSGDWDGRPIPGDDSWNKSRILGDWCDEHGKYEQMVQVKPYRSYTKPCMLEQSFLEITYIYILIVQSIISIICVLWAVISNGGKYPDWDPRLYGYIKRRRGNSTAAEVLFQLYRIWTCVVWFWIAVFAILVYATVMQSIAAEKEAEEAAEKDEMIREYFNSKKK
tara:strand:- start:416 stop:970 length:555 start_codon:yes stop_codon:yes gene_type:complete